MHHRSRSSVALAAAFVSSLSLTQAQAPPACLLGCVSTAASNNTICGPGFISSVAICVPAACDGPTAVSALSFFSQYCRCIQQQYHTAILWSCSSICQLDYSLQQHWTCSSTIRQLDYSLQHDQLHHDYYHHHPPLLQNGLSGVPRRLQRRPPQHLVRTTPISPVTPSTTTTTTTTTPSTEWAEWTTSSTASSTTIISPVTPSTTTTTTTTTPVTEWAVWTTSSAASSDHHHFSSHTEHHNYNHDNFCFRVG